VLRCRYAPAGKRDRYTLRDKAMPADKKLFFKKFLSIFDGVELLKINEETPEYIEGTLSWGEDVRWRVTSDATPSKGCLDLISFIVAEKLLEIDKISISAKALYNSFVSNTGNNWSEQKFESALKELLQIKVARLEDGKIFDEFFVHL
jgi:hypothetical protein